MNDPILITGCARSGTSLIAGIVNMCGAFGGKMSGPTPNNKKGMFENTYIRDKLVKPYLKDLGADPLGQGPLPTFEQIVAHPFVNLGFEVDKVMSKEGFKKGPWFYKGAKMCLVWTQWAKAFPKAQWVIVRRKDEDIIASCLRTSFMRKYTNEEGWKKWVNHHKECFHEMRLSMPDQLVEIWPEEVIKGDLEPIKNMISWLGLKWNDTKIRELITPELWHV